MATDDDELSRELGEALELGEAGLSRVRRRRTPGRAGTCPACGQAVVLRHDGHPRQHGGCPEGRRKRQTPRVSQRPRERCPRCARFVCLRDDGHMRRHRNDANEPCEPQQLALPDLLQEAQA